MRPKSFVTLCLLAVVLLGCSQEAMMEKFTPKEEVEYAKKYLSLFQSRDFEAISKPLDAPLKTDQLQSQLKQIAQFFPADPPANIELVGSQTITNGERWQAGLTFQYEFPSTWLIANVNLERVGDGELVVTGIHVNPIQDSLETLNTFTLKGKTPVHYFFLALAVVFPLFILFTFVTCLRTPIKKRKWLWAIFIMLGIFQFTINWTTGAIAFNPMSFLLLGAAFFYGNKFAPVMLSVALPVGAVIFWIKKNKFHQDRQKEASLSDAGLATDPPGGAQVASEKVHSA